MFQLKLKLKKIWKTLKNKKNPPTQPPPYVPPPLSAEKEIQIEQNKAHKELKHLY